MKVKELIEFYQKEIHLLVRDEKRYPYDNLGVKQTIKIFQQFIFDLKQLR